MESAEHANDGWIVVYDLATDAARIAAVQRASVARGAFGIRADVALFGSPEWWRAVRDGRIVRHEITGTISRCYMGSQGDWPEFEVEADGQRTQWTRMGDQRLYVVGRQVRIAYVMQRLKSPLPGRPEHPVLIMVAVKE